MDIQPKAKPGPWRAETLGLLLLLLGLALLAWQLWGYFVPAYYGLTDENGYLVTAQGLALRGDPAKTIRDPYQFAGETMMQRDPATLFVRQPIGYPLLCAAAYKIMGPDGPFWVSPALALAAVLATYTLVRSVLGPLPGGLAALVIGSHSLVAYYGLRALSHSTDLLLCTLGLWLLWRWYKRGGWWTAGLAGLILGFAVTVRYLDVLLWPAAAFLFAAQTIGWGSARVAGSRHASWKDVAAGLAGITAGLLPVLWYQHVAFGAFWRTGYAAGGNATSFSIGWFIQHIPMLCDCLLRPGLGLVLLTPLAVAGIVALWWRARVLGVFLALWIGLLVGGYTAYYGAPQSNTLLYARFFLGVYPALVLAALWLGFGAGWTGRASRVAQVAVALAALLTASLNFSDARMSHELRQLYFVNRMADAAVRLTTQHAPAGAVVVADYWMAYLLDYRGDFQIYDAGHFQTAWVAKLQADLTHVPHEFDPQRTSQLLRLMGGKTDAQLAALLRDLLAAHLRTGRTVCLLTLQEQRQAWVERLGPDLRLVDVADNPYTMGLYRVELATKDP